MTEFRAAGYRHVRQSEGSALVSQAPHKLPKQYWRQELEEVHSLRARTTGVHVAVNLAIGVLAIPFILLSLWALSILTFGSGLVSTAEENDPVLWTMILGVAGAVPIGAWWIFNLAYMQTKSWKSSWGYWGLSLVYWFLPVIVIAPVFLAF